MNTYVHIQFSFKRCCHCIFIYIVSIKFCRHLIISVSTVKCLLQSAEAKYGIVFQKSD